ncbi:MAG: Holliday junction resolvase RuvX [Pantoea sp. Brub]|nr:Holliday junction resolvase RuvX [Pantoea sp. Brub]
MNPKIILGFDFGMKNIGVAIGQTITRISSPLMTINSKCNKINWSKIDSLLTKWQPNLIIVGLPLNMDGTEQSFTKITRKFVNCLKDKYKIQVYLQDERLTTVQARIDLFEQGGYSCLKKKLINSKSAAIILQDWINKYIN